MNKLQLIRKNTHLSWINQFLQHAILECFLKERITKKIQDFPPFTNQKTRTYFKWLHTLNR